MNERVAKYKGTLTATGGTDGYVTVTANTGCYPGAIGFLFKADGSLAQRVKVTNLNGSTKIGLRFIEQDNADNALRTGAVKRPLFGRSDCSAFNATSIVVFEAQVVPVAQPIYDPIAQADL